MHARCMHPAYAGLQSESRKCQSSKRCACMPDACIRHMMDKMQSESRKRFIGWMCQPSKGCDSDQKKWLGQTESVSDQKKWFGRQCRAGIKICQPTLKDTCPAEIKDDISAPSDWPIEPDCIIHARCSTCRFSPSPALSGQLDRPRPNQLHSVYLSLASRLFGYLACALSYASDQSAPTLQCKYLQYLLSYRTQMVNPESYSGTAPSLFV